MHSTRILASHTKSRHSYHILFMCIIVVAIIIITKIIFDGFDIVRVYVNVRTYYSCKYWYLPFFR